VVAVDRYAETVSFDALILSGGRSSRLGGEPKAGLLLRGETLLAHTVSAASRARSIVVVGDAPGDAGHRDVETVRFVREDPPFGGPAAAIATGVRMLADVTAARAEFTLVLACDMPQVFGAVEALLNAVTALKSHEDGVIALDGGREQFLVTVLRTAALNDAVRARVDAGDVEGLSMRALLAGLVLVPTAVPAGSTKDVDTWADAAAHGVTKPIGG
jgi:molybdopterin-guanine dinucleotide biosynthesis protein A